MKKVSFRSFLCVKENGHMKFFASFSAPEKVRNHLATIGTQESKKVTLCKNSKLFGK